MKNRNIALFGLVLLVIGLTLMGQTFNLFYLSNISDMLIPLIFITLGVWLIIRRKRKDAEEKAQAHFEVHWQSDPTVQTTPARPAGPDTYRPEPAPESFAEAQARQHGSTAGFDDIRFSASPSPGEPGRLRYSKAVGDMFIDLKGSNLQNVHVSGGLGDLEIRIHGGILVEGLNRIIISGFIGDIRIFVPPDMAIFAHCSNFIGDIEVMEKRAGGFGNNVDAQSANYGSASKKLYIAANAFLGDVKIYGM